MTGGMVNNEPPSYGARFNPLSIYQQYPTGRPFYWDDMEGANFNWTKFVAGGGTSTLLTTDAFQGSKCAQMLTTAAANDSSEIFKRIGRLPRSRIGFEFMLKLAQGYSANGQLFQFGIERRATSVVPFYIFYDPLNGGTQPKLRLQSAAGPDTDLILFPAGKGLTVSSAAFTWNPFKLIVDLANSKFVALIYSNNLIDLTSFANGNTFAGTEDWTDEVFCWVKNGAVASIQEARVDNVIVTREEPDLQTLSNSLGLTIQAPPITLTSV